MASPAPCRCSTYLGWGGGGSSELNIDANQSVAQWAGAKCLPVLLSCFFKRLCACVCLCMRVCVCVCVHACTHNAHVWCDWWSRLYIGLFPVEKIPNCWTKEVNLVGWTKNFPHRVESSWLDTEYSGGELPISGMGNEVLCPKAWGLMFLGLGGSIGGGASTHATYEV